MNATLDPRWTGLLRLGGVAALLTAACIPLQIALFLAFPPPASRSVTAWFDLFNESPVLGMLSLDFLMMVEQVLIVPIALGLWTLVHRASESTALIGVAAWLFGAVLVVTSNTGFEMLSLAHGYAAADPAAQAGYLAAAQGMLASYWDMGTSFVFGYVLASVAGILVGAALVRAGVLGRGAGWVLVVANVMGFGIFVPSWGVALSLLSVVVLWGWYAVTGIRLLRLTRRSTERVAALTAPAAA